MSEPARAASAARPPHSQHCPPWCIDCRHDDADPFSPRALLHRGAADTVHVYDQACLQVEAHVRVAYWDKAPNWIGSDPADLERPYVEFSVQAEDGLPESQPGARSRPRRRPAPRRRRRRRGHSRRRLAVTHQRERRHSTLGQSRQP